MKIGYSMWGFLGSGIVDTPDRSRSYRRPVVDALIAAGNEVVFLQHLYEGKRPFRQLGININVLEPGQPLGLYHREDHQEGFLVLAGECVLVVEDEQRALKAWDAESKRRGRWPGSAGCCRKPSRPLAAIPAAISSFLTGR